MEHTMRHVKALCVAAAMIASLSLTSCAAATSVGIGAAQDVPKQVSSEEYTEAFNAFQSCMSERGHAVTDPIVSPVDAMQLIYEATSGAGLEKSYEQDFKDCYAPLGDAEADYFATGQPHMAEDLLTAVQSCMRSNGYELSDAAVSTSAMRAELTGDTENQALRECVLSETQKLYPDIPFVAL